MKTFAKQLLSSTMAMGAILLMGASPASAQEDPDILLPVGLACSDFNLGLDFELAGRKERPLPDKDGLERSIIAGRGDVLIFTNYGTDPENPTAGESIRVKTGGSVQHIVKNEDGSSTVTGTGFNTLILFPTDIPENEDDPLPSTTIYTGTVTYTASAPDENDFSFITVLSHKGKTRDICAELSS